MERDTPQTKRRKAASKALQKNFTALYKAALVGEIPEELYSRSVIDQSTLEYVTKQSLTDRDKGHKIMQEIQKVVGVNPELFEEICTVFSQEEPTKELSQKLKEDYELTLKTELKEDGTAGNFASLRDRLKGFSKDLATPGTPEDAVHKMIKHLVRQHVETSLKADNKAASILQKQIQSLCYDILIPPSLQSWALQLVDEIKELSTAKNTSVLAALQPKGTVHPPLFSKETLYHASICCQAVSTCSNRDLQAFLRSRVSGHILEGVSMSISEDRENVDQYLIAKQKDTLYIAFQSEATLSTWIVKHTTFDEGLKKQTKRIPLRFFVEQLLAGKRIVLTGFSFGGMLACCVAANVWKKSYLPTHLLEKNVVCITFGLPLISIPFVLEAITTFPELESTIHMVFDKRDFIPRILGYYDVGCLQSSRKPLLSSPTTKPTVTSSKRPDGNTKSFQGPFASTFLKSLADLQDTPHPEQTYSGAVSNQNLPGKTALKELKLALQDVLPHSKLYPNILFGTCYMMSKAGGHAITWNPVPKSVAAQELGCLDKATIEKLGTNVFKQHNMDDYQRNISTSYLEKEPQKYLIPTTTQSTEDVKDIALLKPCVKTVEFHEYPNEHIVVLEGDNLWFSHKITLGSCIITTPAQNITRRSIQFSYTPNDATASIVADDGRVEVSLYSHFADLKGRKIMVKQEPYSFSPRQIQLAKHTPSEIIQLAYCCAMLECHVKGAHPGAPTKRFKEIAQFLEEAVRVVPIESIFYAIAYSDHDTALECARAVTAFQPKVLPSEMMMTGLHQATMRMRTGVPPQILEKMVTTALRQVPLGLMPFDIDIQNSADNNLEVIVQALSPFQMTTKIHPAAPLAAPSRHVHSKKVHKARSSRQRPLPPSLATPESSSSEYQIQALALPQILEFVARFPRKNESELSPPASPDIVEYLELLSEEVAVRGLEGILKHHEVPDVVCNMSVEQVYPVYPLRRQTLRETSLQSPIETLRHARGKLASFVEEAKGLEDPPSETQGTQTSNERMLQLVREIHEHDLKLCAALLGAFMEQRIHIPMHESPMDTAKALSSKTSSVAVGAWVLFSLSYQDLHEMLSHIEGNSLLVEIADHIAGILSEKPPRIHDSRYAAKLQFLLQGIKKTVTCSSQYISYSLEYQLCNNPKVNQCKSIDAKSVIKNWDTIFKGDALSLVEKSHRPLVARWLKWSILVHNLREALAKYTCVGVAGLVNSGKSQLVSTLFKVPTQVGTTNAKRTTVPFMYNLDGAVDGLDVIDFPGVDDKDHSVPELAKLLVGLAQVVIFVVDYRKLFSDPAKEWIRALQHEHVPVLVCLTHADRLYAECMDKEGCEEPTPFKQQQIGRELHVLQEKLGPHPTRTVKFYSFYKSPDSMLTPEMLKEVKIGSPQDVGDWLVETFESKLDQKDLSENLHNFIYSKEQ